MKRPIIATLHRISQGGWPYYHVDRGDDPVGSVHPLRAQPVLGAPQRTTAISNRAPCVSRHERERTRSTAATARHSDVFIAGPLPRLLRGYLQRRRSMGPLLYKVAAARPFALKCRQGKAPGRSNVRRGEQTTRQSYANQNRFRTLVHQIRGSRV